MDLLSISHAADRYETEVLLQLERVRVALGRGGYAPSISPVVEKLARSASLNHTVELQTGLDYAIVSVCDSDCDNVDISVTDENGNNVGNDQSEDDVPVVALSPVWSGQFTIAVTAPGCRAVRCTIGIGLFAQPAAADEGREAGLGDQTAPKTIAVINANAATSAIY